MNSFTLTAVGNLGKDPELISRGGRTHTKFYLLGNDYAGKDGLGNVCQTVTTLNFVAFDTLGETIAKHARVGDQLIVEAQVRADNWTGNDGERRFNHAFIVQAFRFGAPGKARRENIAGRATAGELATLGSEF